jgi:hypothetical protein
MTLEKSAEFLHFSFRNSKKPTGFTRAGGLYSNRLSLEYVALTVK